MFGVAYFICPQLNNNGEIIGYLLMSSDGTVIEAFATIESAQAALRGYMNAELANITERENWAALEELKIKQSINTTPQKQNGSSLSFS